jgi:hypothetical protein
MRKDLVVPLTFAALILSLIFVVAPRATAITFEGSPEMYGIDTVGLTLNAEDMPEQHFAAF